MTRSDRVLFWRRTRHALLVQGSSVLAGAGWWLDSGSWPQGAAVAALVCVVLWLVIQLGRAASSVAELRADTDGMRRQVVHMATRVDWLVSHVEHDMRMRREDIDKFTPPRTPGRRLSE